MLDLATERLLENIDASVSLGDAEDGIEAQRQLDEYDPARAPRPDPREPAVIAGVAAEDTVNGLAHHPARRAIEQVREAVGQHVHRIHHNEARNEKRADNVGPGDNPRVPPNRA